MRGLVGASQPATELADRIVSSEARAFAPDLVIAEVTNALRGLVHPDRWPIDRARERLEVFLAWPLEIQACDPMAVVALEAAADLRISTYDAFYAVLSRELRVPLVTADRRLAEAVPNAILVV